MKKYFNVSRYKNLLKLQEDGEISFLNMELLSLKASVAQQTHYNRREDYFILIGKYLQRIITPNEFKARFLQMAREDSSESGKIRKC
mgnify:CR=1 FL=1